LKSLVTKKMTPVYIYIYIYIYSLVLRALSTSYTMLYGLTDINI